MPYRRLPNTDAARIRALETALNNEEFSNINNLPFSLHLRQKIEFFLPKFKTAITNSQCARDKQNVNSRKYAEYTRKAKLYISHFLQVLNFTIARGELKPMARTFYGIDEHAVLGEELVTFCSQAGDIVKAIVQRADNQSGIHSVLLPYGVRIVRRLL